MGTWSCKSFGNDTALDWIESFTDSLDTEIIKNFFIKLDITEEWSTETCDICYAAASIVHSASHEPPSKVPSELKQWIKYSAFVPDKQTIELAINSLEKIVINSKLRELWSETSSFSTWQKQTNALLMDLRSIQLESLPIRVPYIPKTLSKLFSFPAASSNQDIKSLIMSKLNTLKDINKEIVVEELPVPPIYLSVKYKIPEAFDYLINKGAVYNEQQGYEMLCLACNTNQVYFINKLLKMGIKPVKFETFDVSFNTYHRELVTAEKKTIVEWPVSLPLQYALENQYTPIETIQLLAEFGVDISYVDINGYSSLHYAICGLNIEVIKYLLDSKKIDIDFRNGGFNTTALYTAVANNNLDIVKVLLGYSADPNIPDRHNRTCLDIVKDQQISNELTRAGAKTSKQLGYKLEL